MSNNKDNPGNIPQDILDAFAADSFAEEQDDIMLDIEDMDTDACPPDRRFIRGDREAWVYDHGTIAELVYVKVK